MSDKATVGNVIAAFLEIYGVGSAFGVISIHNMPFLDAIVQRANIRAVTSLFPAHMAWSMFDRCLI